MATKKITQLDAIIKANNDDVIPIVDVSGGTTNKITKGDFLKEVNKEIDEIENDLENIELTKRVSGTTIDVDDSAESRVKNIMFCGNSVQATTTGINLVKFDDGPIYDVTLTNEDKNAVIELDGTPREGREYIAFEKIINLPAGRYYLNYGYVSGECTLEGEDDVYFVIDVDGSGVTYSQLPILKDGYIYDLYVFFDVSYDQTDTTVSIKLLNTTESTKTFENFKFNFMLTKDEPSYNWESYTGGLPAPSQAYPQSINSVGENGNELESVTEKIFNENWLIYDAESTTINGITYTVNADKSIRVQGTASADSEFYLIGSDIAFAEIPLMQKGTYNRDNTSVDGSNINFMLKMKEGEVEGYITEGVNFDHRPGINTYKIYISVAANKTVNGTVYPVINKGNTASGNPYVPHKGQTYSISVQEPMRSVEPVRDLFFKNTINSKYYNETLTENAWYEMHNIAYIDSYDGETITTNYMSTTGGLDTGAGVQYVLETPRYLLCTEDQVEKLEEYVEASTYKNITYFFSTNDVPGYQNVSYLQNLAIFSRLEELEENKEDKSNKTTEINEDSTDDQYPSAKAVYNGLEEKQGTLTFDNTPTANSTNPVKSGGIKTYVDGIVGNIEDILEELDIGGGVE